MPDPTGLLGASGGSQGQEEGDDDEGVLCFAWRRILVVRNAGRHEAVPILSGMTHVPPVPGGFTEEEWRAARPWPEYLASVAANRDLWEAHARRVVPDEDAAARLAALPGPRRVLVLTEDWCGDAARSVPVIATACEAAAGVEHRYLDSDAWPRDPRALPHARRPGHPHGDRAGRARRPARRVGAASRAPPGAPEGAAAPGGAADPGDEGPAWYAPIMAWYGRDRGRTTVDELLMVLERGGSPR